MTAKIITTVTTAASSAVSSPGLSSGSGGKSPVFNTHQSMKQMTDGADFQNAISFAEFNKCELKLYKKRDFATYRDDEATFHEEDDYMSDSGKKPGRRPMTDEEIDDDDDDPKIKRKAQNRAAQRAFRERKERYVKDLEKKVRYVQDSHVYATTQLFQENQFLRSVIHRLELENNNLKGDSLDFSRPQDSSILSDKRLPGQSWLATIGPPVPLPVINAFPPTPLAPLQIRPAPTVVDSKSKNIDPVVSEKPAKKSKKQQEPSCKIQMKIKKSKEIAISSTTTSCSPSNATDATNAENSNQQFTFSITTPATLRATSDSELLRKNEPIQAVRLYPDHSHPANCLLGKSEPKEQDDQPQNNTSSSTPVLSPVINYSSSIASSCCSNSVAGEEDYVSSVPSKPDSPCAKGKEHDLLLFDDDTKGFQDILKSFVHDTGGDLDFSTATNTEWNMETLFDSF